jgi:polyphosphate kinase
VAQAKTDHAKGRQARNGHARNGKSGKAKPTARLPRQVYETELYRLQAELVKMQEWMRSERARMVVIFEGRDAAGKGSTIKRVTEYLNPRVARIAALPVPTEREQSQWRWKLSPMDLESITRWEDYSRAKDEMFIHTDIPEAPWHVVESDDKRSARVNMIAHLLSTIPYHDVTLKPLRLPPRPEPHGYVRVPRDMQAYVPDHAAQLAARS